MRLEYLPVGEKRNIIKLLDKSNLDINLKFMLIAILNEKE